LNDTWRSLNQKLRSMTEEEALAALEAERVGPRRVSILQRLHQRYCTLRQSRERVEILKGAQKV
jgi:hypothetical protein